MVKFYFKWPAVCDDCGAVFWLIHRCKEKETRPGEYDTNPEYRTGLQDGLPEGRVVE